MVLAEPLAVTLKVVGVLEALGVKYLVGGSVASSLHGIPRATQDVDLVAQLGLSHVEALVNGLGEGFYADADMLRDAIRRRASFNIIELQTMTKVDIFVTSGTEMERTEMARRQRYELEPGSALWLASPEDIVLQKLDWFRKGNQISERQWSDALGVLKVQGKTLDVGYLKEWAAALNLEHLLAKLFDDAGW